MRASVLGTALGLSLCGCTCPEALSCVSYGGDPNGKIKTSRLIYGLARQCPQSSSSNEAMFWTVPEKREGQEGRSVSFVATLTSP